MRRFRAPAVVAGAGTGIGRRGAGYACGKGVVGAATGSVVGPTGFRHQRLVAVDRSVQRTGCRAAVDKVVLVPLALDLVDQKLLRHIGRVVVLHTFAALHGAHGGKGPAGAAFALRLDGRDKVAQRKPELPGVARGGAGAAVVHAIARCECTFCAFSGGHGRAHRRGGVEAGLVDLGQRGQRCVHLPCGGLQLHQRGRVQACGRGQLGFHRVAEQRVRQCIRGTGIVRVTRQAVVSRCAFDACGQFIEHHLAAVGQRGRAFSFQAVGRGGLCQQRHRVGAEVGLGGQEAAFGVCLVAVGGALVQLGRGGADLQLARHLAAAEFIGRDDFGVGRPCARPGVGVYEQGFRWRRRGGRGGATATTAASGQGERCEHCDQAFHEGDPSWRVGRLRGCGAVEPVGSRAKPRLP